MNKDSMKWGVIGLGVGVAAGIAAGMLLAPKSGKESRDYLATKAGQAKSATSDKISQAGSSVKKVVKKSDKK